ncbi:citrate/2-methylcitrate synthase [Brevundimonas sp.]|uniref:citrate/2-methylcitrate synthase n=1 Tax=Brevundimonas sp. TaxID=1871086 RepID=UPI0019CD42D4|nr:citrate/2-methylcitrate synthase [Brevundimonas sp.]MBD3837213.1 citrate synthase [Brevundimonas sp.]
MEEDRRWIDRSEALTRLGVKAQTLYAYVSRGRIAARPDPQHPRRSLYAAADVARLCGADGEDGGTARPEQGAASRGEADLTSSVSLFAGGRLFYRGLDAVQLAEQATVEDVARRLWDTRPGDCFAGLKPRIDPIVGGATRRRILAVLGRRLTEDRSMRAHDVASLKREAGALLNEVVDSVSGPGPRLYFHQRLTRGLKVAERDGHLLRRALILGAEAGLSDAVLATRSAAAGGASLAGAALAGLTTLEGSTLCALDDVVAYVGEARRDPEGAARRWIALRGSPPGFGGWNVTPDDPRAHALLKTAELSDELAAVRTEGERASGRKADFGLALALVSRRLELGPTGAGDLLMLGRLIGLIAHALDQVIDGSPIRARLRYVGPEPGAN